MRGRGGERGFTLVEVLLAAVLLVVVLFAVLGAADMFGSRTRANADLTAGQERSRQAVERITRELRNASGGDGPAALLRAAPADLVFATDMAPEGPGTWRAVRYCWDGDDLVRQASGGGSVTLPATACPDTGWGAAHVVAAGIATAPFTVQGAGDATAVTVSLGAGGTPALRSAVSLRNRSFDPSSVTCEQTGDGHALLGLGVGVGGMLAIPLTVADLLGLRALLFGAQPPPSGWECP